MVRMTALTLMLMAATLAGCSAKDSSSGFNRGVLKDPTAPGVNQQAPDQFKVRFETTAGVFVIKTTRAWAPRGVDRFYNLVANGFYDEQRFFRVVPGFIVQWGMHGDPEIMAKWRTSTILDDPVKESNKLGTITFAKTGSPNSRSTQLYINLKDNGTSGAKLDRQGFAAFGRVVEGMEVVEAINAEYGGRPDQTQITARGNEYLEKMFPNLDYIERAVIE